MWGMIRLKKCMPYSGGLLFVLLLQIVRVMVATYGENIRMIIMVIGLSILIVGLVVSIFMKSYPLVIFISVMVFPSLIVAIGIYFDGFYIVALGMLLLVIGLSIVPKLLKKYTGL